MANLNYERQLLQKYTYVAGMDEAGRGPLAGPVVTACVVVDENVTAIRAVKDSKKLKEKDREELFDLVKDRAIDYSIFSATHLESIK